MIGNQSDLKVLAIKDYIKNPKESGYKFYHMLVSVPIFLSDSVVDTGKRFRSALLRWDFGPVLSTRSIISLKVTHRIYISRELGVTQMVSGAG